LGTSTRDALQPGDPEDDGPRCLVLLQVDQQLTEPARLRVPPELADPLNAFEVREAEDVEEFGASRRREGPQGEL